MDVSPAGEEAVGGQEEEEVLPVKPELVLVENLRGGDIGDSTETGDGSESDSSDNDSSTVTVTLVIGTVETVAVVTVVIVTVLPIQPDLILLEHLYGGGKNRN